MSYVGGVVRVPCSSIGLMCGVQSCCVINVFRGACCTVNVSVVGSLTQEVDTASLN
jgi:lipid-binding SYLF domain-containing protein